MENNIEQEKYDFVLRNLKPRDIFVYFKFNGIELPDEHNELFEKKGWLDSTWPTKLTNKEIVKSLNLKNIRKIIYLKKRIAQRIRKLVSSYQKGLEEWNYYDKYEGKKENE